MSVNLLHSIAVLIDGDNASSKNIGLILDKISQFGTITLKKIYGDWRQNNLSGWENATLQYAIEPMQQFAYVKGKNATDIALVIEAMDLLHSGKYDGFCLVSSDSDFASLAVRIRKNGIKVFGFGKQTAVLAFRSACDEFFEVEKLSTPSIKKDTPLQPKLVESYNSQQLKCDTKLLNALRDIITNTPKQKADWLNYGTFGQAWKQKYPQIKPEHYGYTKWIEIIEKIDIFKVLREPSAVYVGLKSNKQAQNTTIRSNTQTLQNDKPLINALTVIIQENKNHVNNWTNLSYLASQIHQNYPNINIKKHHYKKFSDLIIAMDVFDIKKENKQIYVKIKNSQPKNPSSESPKNPVNHAAATPNTQEKNHQPQNPQLILTGKIDIQIYSRKNIDNVLWRLTPNKKVRHDDDIIFYGQMYTKDGTITLEDTNCHHFFCDLSKQPDDISHIILTASHDSLVIDTPITVIIQQNNETVYYHRYTPQEFFASALLFALARTTNGWQILSNYKPVKHKLSQLCQFFGIEVAS